MVGLTVNRINGHNFVMQSTSFIYNPTISQTKIISYVHRNTTTVFATRHRITAYEMSSATFYTTSSSILPTSFYSTSPSISSSSVNRSRLKRSHSVTVSQLESPIVLGFGGVGVDLLATVATFPNPDDKIRTTNLKVQGGGNAGNALTCAARLGLNARLISKVANDAQGRGILEELKEDGVDVSYFAVSEGGNSPFTYVIVDNQTKTRTCIHTPGSPPMITDDISESTLLTALDGVKLVYFDVRLPETALVVAHKAISKKIPILIDAERPREGLDDLIYLSDYIVCSEKFPQTWTGAPSVPSALVSMLLRLPKVKFVIVTLGADGCIMLERSVAENSQAEEMDVDDLVEQLKRKSDSSTTGPTCISSDVTRLKAKGVGTIYGKLFIGTAEKIPQSELVDTTGAGDAFIGAVLYAICTNKTPEQMLPFAAQVAAISCRALGARAGLPRLTDPRLTPFSQ